MFVITTRSFPPEVGGMQTLLGDLAHNLAKHGKVQVFADSADGDSDFDNQQLYRIERIKGFKFLQKYRKKNQVEIFCSGQKDVRALIADHWKSIEKVSENLCKKIPTLCLIHGKDINQPLRSLRHTRMLNSLKKTKYIIANSQFTKNLAIEKGVPGEYFSKTISISDRKQAIKAACQLANEGDIILIAGKGHETYQEIKGERFDFDDFKIINELLKALNK